MSEENAILEAHETAEFEKATPNELIALHNIYVFQTKGLVVTDDPGRAERHLAIINRLLGVKPEDSHKRLLPRMEIRLL